MSNRSGTPYSAPTDADRRPVMMGVSTVDGITPVPLEVDPSTGQLQTSGSGGGGSGNVNITEVGGNAVTTTLPVSDAAAESSLSSIATNTGNSATSANQTNGNMKSQLYDPTSSLSANVVAGDTGFNGVATVSGSKQYSFTTSTTGAQMIGPYNCEGYSFVEVNYSSSGTGLALTGQFAPTSGGTYFNSSSWAQTSGTPNGAISTTANVTYRSAVMGNSFQLNVTALTGGTFSGTVTLRSVAPPFSSTIATQGGTWSNSSNSFSYTGTITTSSSSLSSGSLAGSGGFAPITIYGTYSGVSFGITESDNAGTSFFNVPIYDATANAWLAPGSTLTPGTNASKVYWVPVFAVQAQIKVLASAYSTGTANIHIGVAGTNNPGSTMSQIMDAAGNARGANVDANGNLQVNSFDSSGNALQVAQGSTTSGQTGPIVQASVTTSAPSYTTGQTSPLSMSTSGSLRVTAGTSSANIGNVGSSSATGLAVPANAFYESGRATTALPTAATPGNLTGAMYDKFGRQVVIPQTTRDLVGSQNTTSVANSATTIVTAGSTGIYNDITSVAFTNTSATATSVTMTDGTSIYTFYVPAGDMRGAVYQVPLAATSSATAWTATAGSSVTSLTCTVTFIKNQ